MPELYSRLGAYLREIRRRKVHRATLLYLAFGFASIEAVDILSPHLSLPNWAFTAVLWAVILGFLVILPISWHFDLTSEGLKRVGPPQVVAGPRPEVVAEPDPPVVAEPPPPVERTIDATDRSIAVLPFSNLSDVSDNEYFSDGITEEIINALTHVPGLRVAARSSSFSFKGKAQDVTEIGQRLKVATVLEGSVRRAGSKLRITAQLVSCTDGYHLWSESYNREMEDVFAIQDEIACAIAERLKVELLGGERAPLVRRHTEDLDAYHYYLKGRYVWNRRTADGLRRSIDFFGHAIAADERYALAYAGLADAYSLLGWYRHLPPREAFEKTKSAATAALEIDDSLAEAHTSLAYARFLYDWEWDSAEAGFRRAIELNSSYSTALHWYAEFLMAMGRLEEAKEWLDRARELDPLSLSVATGVGWVLYFMGRFDAAIEEFENILAVNPDFVIVPWFLGPAYVQVGEHERAIALYEHWIPRLKGQPGLVAYQAHALALAGRRDEALSILQRLEDTVDYSEVLPDNRALIFVGLGETKKALDCLEEALKQRCWPLVFLKVEPVYSALRSEPRFEELVARIGLAA